MQAKVAAKKERSDALSLFESLGLREFVALDLETTGLDAELERVTEVGLIRFRDGVGVEHFEQLVNPGKPLDPFITALTGLTDDDLRNQPPFSVVAERIIDFIGTALIVGQNVSFDLEFLATEGGRLSGKRGRGSDFHFPQNEVLDTAQLGRVFWPEWPRFGLSTLAERFGVEQATAHRALADAHTVGEVLCHMVEALPERVWEEMAEDLAFLIGGTFHRSERFFARVSAMAKESKAPQVAPTAEAQGAETTEDEAATLPSIEELFGKEGHLKRILPHFEWRPAQLQMAEAAKTACAQNQILLCEAPTGVGKSLAYLVSSALWILEDERQERQVIVSSYTKALQEQLHRKEMPTLRALGFPVRSAVLKGRENYLCRRRLRNLIREAPVRLSDEDRIRLMPLVRWATATETGDISQMGGFQPNAAPWLWAQVCSDAAGCSGSNCGPAKGCFFRAAQERAARSQIVLVNHALLFSDPSRFLQKPAPLRKLVLDEGHHIERAVVGALSIELDSFALRGRLGRLLEERSERGLLARLLSSRSKGAELGDEARDSLAEIRTAIRRLYTVIRSCFEEWAGVLPFEALGDLPKMRFRQGTRVHEILASSGGVLLILWQELGQKLKKVRRLLQQTNDNGRVSKELLLELRSSSDALQEIESQLTQVLQADDEEWVFWVEQRETSGRSLSLHGSPIFIGSFLKENFWPSLDTATVTSATLSAQGTFEHCRARLGLTDFSTERLREEILPNPFELSRQMRLLVPAYLPHPRGQSEDWVSAVENLIAEIMRRHRRGTLVLTTSLELLNRLGTTLRPVAQSLRRTILLQGRDGAPAELLAEFRKRKDAVLIGASNFWEGVDVIGEALEILILTRLPFDVPTDPWIAARFERLEAEGKDAFHELSIPEVVLRLRQGLGRLIRHRRDRGIALITDSRIFTTRFGAVIQANLPVKPRAASSEDELWRACDEFFKRDNASVEQNTWSE
ncbi:MAG: helicase C-terminal domain-containing protein [bacterium]